MTTQLVVIPEILHLQLNRFDFSNFYGPTKIDTPITCPQQIDLKNYLISNHKNPSTTYKLYGILVHVGTVMSGHYFAELNLKINQEIDEWICFNDGCVYRIQQPATQRPHSKKLVYQETPYILIYIRNDCIQSFFSS